MRLLLNRLDRQMCAILLIFLCQAALVRADSDLIADFESDGYGDWKVTGQAFGPGPALGTLSGQMAVSGYLGSRLVNTFYNGDGTTGTLTSPKFTIRRSFINFLIGGGKHPGQTCINLLINGKVVRTATGKNDRPGGTERLTWQSWNVSDLAGRVAAIQIIDNSTGGWGHINIDQIMQSEKDMQPKPVERKLKITQRYLHLPVKSGAEMQRMKLMIAAKPVREFDIELADGQPDFWAFCDVSKYRGQQITLRLDATNLTAKVLEQIAQSDEVPNADEIYREPLRPQFHFSSMRGWTNDPNGLVFYDGEYHLFYQHNPYGTGWGNMHWGHAVSSDLLHWKELPDALYPWTQAKGHCFSGSAVVDWNNTAGFATGAKKTLVAIFSDYPDSDQSECIAFSNDRGRTFTYYSGNPVVKHFGRDPKVFWYAPGKFWVMVVYDEYKGKQYAAIYNSTDLKSWAFRSRIEGYYECPELFELPVDGNPANTRWILYAADAKYAVGSFDGGVFTPDSAEKYQVHFGNYYASQTYNEAPDGRRVQIGWAQIGMKGMPFNNMMSFPTELTLRTTEDGVRMFAKPIDEIATLHKAHRTSSGTLREEEPIRIPVSGQLFDIRAEFDAVGKGNLGIEIGGTRVVYDMSSGKLMDAPMKPMDGKVRMQLLVDRSSIEICGNDGRVYITLPFRAAGPITSVSTFSESEDIAPYKLDVYELNSAVGTGLQNASAD